MMICVTSFHPCVCKFILDRQAAITSVIHAFRGIEIRIALQVSIPVEGVIFIKARFV